MTGTSSERKQSVISKLNAEFHSYLERNLSIRSAYEAMVNRNPYKVLANYSYDWDEQPLGNDTENVQMTDVSSFNINIFLVSFLSFHIFKIANLVLTDLMSFDFA